MLTLVQMFAVAAMAANAKDALDSRSSAGFAAAYAAVRFVLVAQYFRARHVPEARAARPRATSSATAPRRCCGSSSALVPAPDAFLDLGARLRDRPRHAVAGRSAHSVSAPPDAAHLPERFGLFTLILLGESVVAVMQGMESQEDWPPAAACRRFSAWASSFLIWWWYFDGADGASEQPVRTRRDAVRFHVWSYAHFPLALGIVVAGVGVQRIVTAAARAELAAAEAMLLAAALSLVMVAVTVVGATSGSRRRHGWFDGAAHSTIAAATLGLGLLAPMTSPVNLIVVVAVLASAQLALSLSHKHGTLRETVVTSGYGDGDIPSTRRADEPFRYRSKNATV